VCVCVCNSNMIGVAHPWITFPSQTSFSFFLPRWVWKNRDRNSKTIKTFFYSLPSCHKGFPFLPLASTPPSFLLHFFSLFFLLSIKLLNFFFPLWAATSPHVSKCAWSKEPGRFSSTSTRIIEQFHNWIAVT